mmetsp:Transcript_71484/g.221028  ORF Transcript_71484/g.221028 Transcript_71484/m.221028 type:complete len:503 (-) Transcript_71484:55-1563(-)
MQEMLNPPPTLASPSDADGATFEAAAFGQLAPEASPSASLTRTSIMSVKDLPDLTGRLIKEGLHEEYLRYRARYLMWRQGGTSGAVGELADLGTARRQDLEVHQQELWHPTPQKFDFFYTVSYWVAIASEVGSMVLCFANFAPLLLESHKLNQRLLKVISFVGDLFFSLTAYLTYFEVINVRESGRLFYFFPAWGPVRERVSLESLVGVVVFLLAMVLWDIPATLDLMPSPVSEFMPNLLHRVPTAIGGLGFFVGGVCEVVHNWSRPARDVVRWISLINAVSGAFFWVGGLACFFHGGDRFSDICQAAAISGYVASSALLIVMWRGNDFGLTLLRQLNSALRAGSPVSISLAAGEAGGVFIRQGTGLPRPARSADGGGGGGASREQQSQEVGRGGRLSTRGVAFLILYCWLCACVLMNCFAGMFATGGRVPHLLDLVGGILWLFVVAIVLTIHSSLTSVPNQQPYRLAMLAMRATLMLVAVVQTLIFSRWIIDVQHPHWIPA